MKLNSNLLYGLYIGVAMAFTALATACEHDSYDTGDGSLSYLRCDFADAHSDAQCHVDAFLTDEGTRIVPASVVGAALFAGVTLFGSLTAHRTFTHSIVGCALWYVAVCLLWPQIAPAFGIGLCSHLILDLLNKASKGSMQLFFPLKTRVCLDVCRADGFANALIWSASVIVCVVYVGWLVFSRF